MPENGSANRFPLREIEVTLVRSGLRSAMFVALLFSLAGGAFAQARKNACTKYDETHLDACASGKQPVWAYDFSGPDTSGQIVQSTGFNTAQSAERDRKAAQKLCEMLDEYFNHTHCRTTYDPPYCAACDPAAQYTKQPPAEEQVWLEKSSLLLDQWQAQAAAAIKTFATENPTPNPYANVGSVLRDYANALKDAVRDTIRLRMALQNLRGGVSLISSQLQQAVNSFQQDQSLVQTAQTRYRSAVPSQPAAPPAANVPSGAWIGQQVDVNGQQTVQNITVTGDQITIVQNAVSGSSGQTYIVPHADLSASTVSIRQQGSAWIASVTMSRRSARLHIYGSNGYTDDETVSRFELFFADQDDAQAAVQSLISGN